MTQNITQIEEGKHKVEIDFSDEDIDLQASTTVLGTSEDAQRYVKTFASDVKRNNRGMFPPPPQPDPEDEMLNE